MCNTRLRVCSHGMVTLQIRCTENLQRIIVAAKWMRFKKSHPHCEKNPPRICVAIDLRCRFWIRSISIYVADGNSAGKENSAMKNNFILRTTHSISVSCEHTLIIKGKCIQSFLTILCLWSFWSQCTDPAGNPFSHFCCVFGGGWLDESI